MPGTLIARIVCQDAIARLPLTRLPEGIDRTNEQREGPLRASKVPWIPVYNEGSHEGSVARYMTINP